LNCQNAATLESAHKLLRTITSNPKFADGVDTAEMLEDVLDGIGFGGLWRSATFHTQNEHERECTALTDRLIEVRASINPQNSHRANKYTAHYCIARSNGALLVLFVGLYLPTFAFLTLYDLVTHTNLS
jgi:hypothetical protein